MKSTIYPCTMTKPSKQAENTLLEQQVVSRVIEMLLEKGLVSDTQTKAADLEIAIRDAINTGKPKVYQTLALTVANTLKASGLSGPASKPGKLPPSKQWLDFKGTDNTPKTDILVGQNRISLKMGRSQFMSGERGEAKATLLAAADSIGLNQAILKKALASIDHLTKAATFTVNVTKTRLKPGYVNPDTGEKVPGRADKEVQALMSQEAAQAKFQKDLTTALDPNVNPGLKLAFVKEAIDGKVKFADSVGTAVYLLTVAGHDTFYGNPKTGKPGVAQLAPQTDLRRFVHLEKITPAVANKYQDLVQVSISFKSRNHGTSISDVVKLLLDEAEDFKENLRSLLATKKEHKNSYDKTLRMLNEGAWDDLKGMLGSAWNQVKALWQRALSAINSYAMQLKQMIVAAAEAGIQALLDLFGIDMEVATSPVVDWFI